MTYTEEEFRRKLEIIQQEMVGDSTLLNVEKLYDLYIVDEKKCIEKICCHWDCDSDFVGHYCNNMVTEGLENLSGNVKKQILYGILVKNYNNFEGVLKYASSRYTKW